MALPPMPLLRMTSPETVEKCKSLPLRPSDVFICSYPKSGTTWTQHIVLSLILADRRHRSQSNGEEKEVVDFDHVSDYAPFYDIDAHWEPDNNSLTGAVRRNHERLGQRVFNTHLRWDMLPKRREEEQGDSNEDASPSSPAEEQSSQRPACGKFIYVTRNLPDVCASFYHHLSNTKEGTYSGDFDAFARDWMAGKVPFGSPLHHLLSFAEGFSDNRYHAARRDETTGLENGSPLLLLSYEKMKENLRGEVLRIVDFLNLDAIPIDVLDRDVLPTFDFRSMKESARRFQPISVTWLNGYQFLRKGECGDGRRMMAGAGGRGAGSPLMEAFRNWVSGEDYRRKIEKLIDAGLDEETADKFLAVAR